MSDWLVGKKAVANALGVSVSTVKRYLKRYPDFPAHRRGGTIFVSPAVHAAWVEHRKIKICPTCGIAFTFTSATLQRPIQEREK